MHWYSNLAIARLNITSDDWSAFSSMGIPRLLI